MTVAKMEHRGEALMKTLVIFLLIFQVMGVPPVIIHFRLEFSLTKTIQLLGTPILGNLHIFVISLEPLGQSSLGWNRLSQHIILGTGNHVHASLSKSDNIVTIVMFSYIVAILLQSKTYIYIYTYTIIAVMIL